MNKWQKIGLAVGMGTAVITIPGALDCHYSNNVQQPTLDTIYLHIQQSMSVRCIIPE